MLQLCFLGPPVIAFTDAPLVDLNRSQVALRLLALLVMRRQQAQSRSMLAATFWPDLSEARARRTLNNIVWRLHSALGVASNRLLVTSDTLQVQLTAEDWLDVTAFDQGTRAILQTTSATSVIEQQDHFAATLALYRGEFLAGFEDEWCLAQRDYWRTRYCHTLEWLAGAYQQQDNLERALATLRQLLTVDPDQPNIHQRLIELYLALDQPTQAQAHFVEYRRRSDELQLPLTPELRQLAARHQWQQSTPFFTLPAGVEVNPAYLRRQLEILCKNDELFDLMADRQRQHENLLHAQALADQLNDPVVQIDILARRAWTSTHQGDYTTAIALAQVGLELTSQQNLQSQRAPLHRQLGIANEEQGDFKAALHHYSKALELDAVAQTGVRFLPADLNNVASVKLTLAHYFPGIHDLERAQKLLTVDLQPTIQIKVLGNLGYAWMKLGQLERAATYLAQGLALAQQVGEQSAEWWLAILQAKLYHFLSDNTYAIKLALHTYSATSQARSIGLLSYIADTLAWLYCAKHDPQQGLVWAQQAHNDAVQHGHWRYHIRGAMRLAQAYRLCGEDKSALDPISQAVTAYEQKRQELEEEPELFYNYAKVANTLDLKQLASQAQQRADIALSRQLAGISEQAMQRSFLAIHLMTLLPE